jgi:hypothetical protein
VSLEELDERAALLRRVDNKYVVDGDRFATLADRLRGDHDVLEIDGRRAFAYESVYFDTAGLRCFHDHVEDREPRFKVRTRYYHDSRKCTFEVKLKTADGETDKRQMDYPPDERDRITAAGERFVVEALESAELSLDDPLVPSLRTSFDRSTLAAQQRPERLTCDRDVELERIGGGARRLRDGLIVLETKSADGDSPADRVLAEMGIAPVSLSKYKLGIAMLTQAGAAAPQEPSARFFE